MSAGFKCIVSYEGWMIFGATLFILGTAFSIVIMFGISWRGPIIYWQQIEATVRELNRIKDPAVWSALGFRSIPETITIQEKTYDEKNSFVSMKIKTMPIPAHTLNAIANQVLLSENYDFTEEKYKDKVKNFRKIKTELMKEGYIVPKNKKNVRLGYAWTNRGVKVLYEYADVTVIELIEKQKKEEKNATEKRTA
jgi:hypothetical protein